MFSNFRDCSYNPKDGLLQVDCHEITLESNVCGIVNSFCLIYSSNVL